MSATEEKPLLVVVTRAYAPRGSTDDEFVQEWGFDVRYDYRWHHDERELLLLVVHGYKKHDYQETVKTALAERKTTHGLSVSKAYLFHHSIEAGLQGVEQSIDKAINDETVDIEPVQRNTRAYHSEGRSSVDGLARILEEGQNYPTSFKDAVETAATGRRLFAGKLYELRSGLLCLRFAFDAKNREAFYRQARRFSEVVASVVSTKWNWLADLEDGPWSDSVATARKTLHRLEGPEEKDIWLGYIDPGWFSSEKVTKNRIHEDLKQFARQVDILIDALEDSPFCRHESGNGK